MNDLSRLLPPPPIAYSPDKFAEACGISKSLLYKLWRMGKGPPYKIIEGRRLVPAVGGAKWLDEYQNDGEQAGGVVRRSSDQLEQN